MPAQCGIPSNANERGCNGSVSGSAPKRHVSRERVLRGLGGGRFPQGGTIDTDEKKIADGARKDGEGQQTRVAAREKEKALGPCELRALLRDEPSIPCTRHGRRHITGHRRTLRSDSTGYARALDRAHNLTSLARRDRNRFRSLQGRVTTATPIPRYWTSCMAG